MEPATRLVSATTAATPLSGTTDRIAAIASGGSSIGAMGRQTLRDMTVLVTEVTAAALLMPSTWDLAEVVREG